MKPFPEETPPAPQSVRFTQESEEDRQERLAQLPKPEADERREAAAESIAKAYGNYEAEFFHKGYDAREPEIAELKRQLDEAGPITFQNRLKYYREIVQRLEAELAEEREQLGETFATMKTLERECDRLSKENAELKHALNEGEMNVLYEVTRQRDSLSARLNEHKIFVAQLTEERDLLSKENAEHLEVRAKLNADIVLVRHELGQQIAAANAERDELCAKLELAGKAGLAMIQNLQAERDELKARCEKAEAERDHWNKKYGVYVDKWNDADRLRNQRDIELLQLTALAEKLAAALEPFAHEYKTATEYERAAAEALAEWAKYKNQTSAP